MASSQASWVFVFKAFCLDSPVRTDYKRSTGVGKQVVKWPARLTLYQEIESSNPAGDALFPTTKSSKIWFGKSYHIKKPCCQE